MQNNKIQALALLANVRMRSTGVYCIWYAMFCMYGGGGGGGGGVLIL